MRQPPRRGEVNPGQPSSCGKTPLPHATQDRHEVVMNMLLGRVKVNPDKPGQTQFSCAASNRLEGAVRILLPRKEANPVRVDNYNLTSRLLLGVAISEL